eukprot:3737794-Pyramimonas_sp.AAC.1
MLFNSSRSCGPVFMMTCLHAAYMERPPYAELFPGKKGARYTMWGLAGCAYHYTERPAHTWGSRGDSGLQRIALQNMMEVVCDLDSFGILVYISGDSLLVVSWLQGVWR